MKSHLNKKTQKVQKKNKSLFLNFNQTSRVWKRRQTASEEENRNTSKKNSSLSCFLFFSLMFETLLLCLVLFSWCFSVPDYCLETLQGPVCLEVLLVFFLWIGLWVCFRIRTGGDGSSSEEDCLVPGPTQTHSHVGPQGCSWSSSKSVCFYESSSVVWYQQNFCAQTEADLLAAGTCEELVQSDPTVRIHRRFWWSSAVVHRDRSSAGGHQLLWV